jgi:large subunit ribosomal protein L31
MVRTRAREGAAEPCSRLEDPVYTRLPAVPLGCRTSFLRRIMKKTGHPDYHEITVVMTDGTEYKTRSTYGKAGDVMRLEIDSKTHPAWTGVHRLNESGGQLAKFNKRFKGFGNSKG